MGYFVVYPYLESTCDRRLLATAKKHSIWIPLGFFPIFPETFILNSLSLKEGSSPTLWLKIQSRFKLHYVMKNLLVKFQDIVIFLSRPSCVTITENSVEKIS